MPKSRWGKFAVILYLFLIHLMALFFVLDRINGKKETENPDYGLAPVEAQKDTFSSRTDSGIIAPVDTSLPIIIEEFGSDTGKLIIPVAGVKRKELQDTYTQSRSGGRVHNAIDIMAAEGIPVVAVADGEIAKFFDSKQGGITIYQWSTGRRRLYYYAHLQRRAAGIAEKTFVKRGTVIGYVGNTGNAGPGNFHLHFAIMIPADTNSYWKGTDVNPYPILKEGIEVPAVRE